MSPNTWKEIGGLAECTRKKIVKAMSDHDEKYVISKYSNQTNKKYCMKKNVYPEEHRRENMSDDKGDNNVYDHYRKLNASVLQLDIATSSEHISFDKNYQTGTILEIKETYCKS